MDLLSVEAELEEATKRLEKARQQATALEQVRAQLLAEVLKAQGVVDWLQGRKAEFAKAQPTKPEGG